MESELLERLRKELEAERDAAVAELERLGADPYSEKVSAIDVDDNFADTAAATAERSEILALIEAQRERLGSAQAALAKIADGTYGTCEICGETIADARLEARPLSIRCVDCARSA